uniref:RING-type E3 ubiquitin transferase n=1 Tax=Oryza nivara TaxID=4536 RepID=A0A0E0HDC2_ORYNI
MSTVAAPAVEDASKHWAPHGAVLTAFVVGINLLMVLLVFFYFWRFFSGKRGPPPSSSSMAGGADDEGTGRRRRSARCFRDGDLARLLPRCGHRFHADCVGAWLRLHSTWPLCRATALPLAASTATASVPNNNDDPKDDAAAHCPV